MKHKDHLAEPTGRNNRHYNFNNSSTSVLSEDEMVKPINVNFNPFGAKDEENKLYKQYTANVKKMQEIAKDRKKWAHKNGFTVKAIQKGWQPRETNK